MDKPNQEKLEPWSKRMPIQNFRINGKPDSASASLNINTNEGKDDERVTGNFMKKSITLYW